VAKVEREGAIHEKKTKQVHQQFELLKLQTDQAKSAKDQQTRLLNAEKVKISLSIFYQVSIFDKNYDFWHTVHFY